MPDGDLPMPEAKKGPCSILPFKRQKNLDAWPGSTQLDSGHLVVSNRSWRTQWPDIDLEPCNKCNLCILYCPDAAIVTRTDGFPHVEANWCKGCGICAAECPKRCVHMVDEAQRDKP